VEWYLVGPGSDRFNKYAYVSFVVKAKEVARPGDVTRRKKESGEKFTVWGWQAYEGEVHDTTVHMYLHNLIYYLKVGESNWRDLPFAKKPLGYRYVVLHMGECRKGCCAPWHLKLRTQRENVVRGLRHRRNRGRNREQYKSHVPGVELSSSDESCTSSDA
jgi:hypothetical protein